MEHLTDREIFDFASADKLGEDTMVLGRRVNDHILCCEKCARRYKKAVAVVETVQSLLDFGGDDCTQDAICTEISAAAVALQAAQLEVEMEKREYNL